MGADYVARVLSNEHALLDLARKRFPSPDAELVASILASPLPMRSATVTAKTLIDSAHAQGYRLRAYIRIANWLMTPPYTPTWAKRGEQLVKFVHQWADGTPGKKTTAIVLEAAALLQECYAKPENG